MEPKESKVTENEIVPFFETNENQIKFEFFYLIVLFFIGCIFTSISQFSSFSYANKVSLLSILGGFWGGWVYNTKWFYRVTAKGKNNQYNFLWEPHKFYWRIFIPFLAALVAFCSYTIISPNSLILSIKGHGKAKIAFSFCFVLGYFSDSVLNRLAYWAESLLPKKNKD